MSKPRRADRVKVPTKPAPAATGHLPGATGHSPGADGALPPAVGEPNPPKRRPLFLLASAIAMTAWLVFLLWMAIR